MWNIVAVLFICEKTGTCHRITDGMPYFGAEIGSEGTFGALSIHYPGERAMAI